MGANRPQALKKRAYVEIDLESLESTGEVRIIGDPIIAPTITERVPRGKFEITYTAELFEIMKNLGNKKIEVLSYMLDHKDGNNALNMTNSQLAKAVGTSRPTVIETLRTLSDAGLVGRKGSVIMISPRLMVKGNQLREAWLMRKYEEITDEQAEIEKNAIEAEIDPQLSFLSDGTIVQKAK